ncbi:MAG TPA: hypothetical protein VHA79_13560 [Mycobacteriales bacterium]|jgi:hypothetical protein|nr:hypothetical protein [Mycobacteriales bacterium]
MTVKGRGGAHGEADVDLTATIDLTKVSYFPEETPPLVLQEASGFERVRDDVPDPEDAAAGYRVDRRPKPTDDSLFFGGLGLASVMDVSAHPVRARLRRVNVMTVFAISVVAAIAAVILTMVAAFKP